MLPLTDTVIINNGHKHYTHSYLLHQIPFFEPMVNVNSQLYCKQEPIILDLDEKNFSLTLKYIYSQSSLRRVNNKILNEDKVEIVLLLDFFGLENLREILFNEINFHKAGVENYMKLMIIPRYQEQIFASLAREPCAVVEKYSEYLPNIIPYYGHFSRSVTKFGQILRTIQQIGRSCALTEKELEIWNELPLNIQVEVMKLSRTANYRWSIEWYIKHQPERIDHRMFMDTKHLDLVFQYIDILGENSEKIKKVLVHIYQYMENANVNYERRQEIKYQSFGPLIRNASTYDLGFLWGMFLYSFLCNNNTPYNKEMVGKYLDKVTFPSLLIELKLLC